MSSHSCVIQGGSWTAPHLQERHDVMPVSLVCVVLCVVLVGEQQPAHMVPVWVQTLLPKPDVPGLQLRSGLTAQWIQGFRGSGEDPSLPQLPPCSHGFEPWPQTAQCSGLVSAHAFQEEMRRPGSFPGQKVPGSALGLDTVGLTAPA